MNVNWDVIDEEAEKTANQVKTDASSIEANTESINSIKQEQTEQNDKIQANEDKINSSEEDIKELQEENKALKEDMDAISIRGQATGENLTLEDSSNARFDKFVVSGNSIQDGEPNPEKPIEIRNCGDNGSVNFKITDNAEQEQTFNLELKDKFSLKAMKDYKDSFVRKNDGWYKEEKIGKWILDGENIEFSTFIKYDNYIRAGATLQGIHNSGGFYTYQKGLALCTHFVQNNNQEFNYENRFALWNAGDIVNFTFNIDKFQNITEANEWLKENNVTVIGALATPNYIKLPDNLSDKLDQIKKLRSYKGTTHIFSEDEISPVFDVTYKKDLETILNKLSTETKIEN